MLNLLMSNPLAFLYALIVAVPEEPYYHDDNITTLYILLVGLAAAVVFLIVYVVVSFFYMKIFAKAGVPAWKAWVPVVNIWKFFELGGYKGALSFLFVANIIPFLGQLACMVGIVFMIMAAHQVGLKLGKHGAWVAIFIFLGVIWLAVMAFDKSEWNDSLGKPALGPERPPASPIYGGGAPPMGGYPPAL